MFYFRDGANYASVYTQSKIISENIKWNLNLKNKKINALMINARNANAFTGKKGYQGLKEIADELAIQLSIKQKNDEEKPMTIKPDQILFGCTGTIGEKYPTEKIAYYQISDILYHNDKSNKSITYSAYSLK